MEYLIGSGLPSYPAGLTDKDASLVQPLYSAVSTLAQQLSLQTGQVKRSSSDLINLDKFDGVKIGNISKIAVLAGEVLPYGSLLCLVPAGSGMIALKASNTDLNKPALALCDVVGGLQNGQYAEVMFLQGRTLGITGSVFGATYYLGVDGAVSLAMPTADGVIKQAVGVGLSGAGFYLNIRPVDNQIMHITIPSAGTLRAHFSNGGYSDHAV